jgi:hypothetical protein
MRREKAVRFDTYCRPLRSKSPRVRLRLKLLMGLEVLPRAPLPLVVVRVGVILLLLVFQGPSPRDRPPQLGDPKLPPLDSPRGAKERRKENVGMLHGMACQRSRLRRLGALQDGRRNALLRGGLGAIGRGGATRRALGKEVISKGRLSRFATRRMP